jgi:aryl-alcohol dehydrogenase-like predicted oxidoreductase/Pyruvate/2-oxoacid:ferredoxin oxidoreductase delta subunit
VKAKLKYNMLKGINCTVSEFCLGLLPMGPRQANASPVECIKIIERAYSLGVNFFDTAEIYQTQAYLGQALSGVRSQVIVATKSFASSYDEMARSVEHSLKELKTDYIDIYLLHSARLGVEVFSERSGAISCLQEYKRVGVIRAVGIATHNCHTVGAASSQEDIDVIFALINMKGIGVLSGSVEDMKKAILKAYAKGKGVYAMKALAGGILLPQYAQALDFARSVPGISAVAMGVVTLSELENGVAYFLGNQVEAPKHITKSLYIHTYLCSGCGSCLEVCHNEAIVLVDGKAQVDHEKCLRCGYCSYGCPQFCIRWI